MNPSAVNQSHPRSEATLLELLSPLGEVVEVEGVMQDDDLRCCPLTSPLPQGEKNMR